MLIRTKSVIDKLNIADIEPDGLIVSFDLTYTRAYELQGIDQCLSPPDTLLNMEEKLQALLLNLDDHITLQIASRVRYGGDPKVDDLAGRLHNENETISLLNKDYIRGLKTLPQRQHRLVLFVSYDRKPKSVGWGPKLGMKSPSPTHIRTVALDTLNRFESYSTLDLTPMDGPEMRQYCFEYLNPDHAPPLFTDPRPDLETASFYERHDWLKNISLRDMLLRRPITNLSPTLMQSGDAYITTLNLIALPLASSMRFNEAFFDHAFAFDMAFQISTIQPEQSQQMMKRIKAIGATNSMFKRRNQPRIEHEQLAEIEQVKPLIELDVDKMLMLRISFVVRDQDPQSCLQKARMIEARFNGLEGCQFIRDDYCHLDNYFSHLPGCYHYNARRVGVLASDLCSFIPIHQTWKGTRDIQFLLQNNDHELLPLTYLAEQEVAIPNTLVAGKPGEGKSFFCNWLITRLIGIRPNTFVNIIDNGGSYKKLYNLFQDDAIYLEMDYKKECAFDFFSQKQIVTLDETQYARYLNYMTHLLCLTIETDGEPSYSESEKYIIEQGIHRLYEQIQDTDIPLLEDYQTIIEQLTPRDEDDEQFMIKVVKNLDSYTDPKSAKSAIFNQRSCFNFNKKMLFIDIQKIDQDPKFQAIYNFIINQNIRDRMIHYPDWKQINVWDEVWKSFRVSKSKDLMEEAARKGRKNDTSILLISQFVDDYLDPSIAPIRNACPVHFMFKTTDLDLLETSPFNYPSSAIQRFSELRSEKNKASKFLIKWADQLSIGQLQATPLDKELCATDAETFQKYQDIYTSQNGPSNGHMLDLLRASTCA